MIYSNAKHELTLRIRKREDKLIWINYLIWWRYSIHSCGGRVIINDMSRATLSDRSGCGVIFIGKRGCEVTALLFINYAIDFIRSMWEYIDQLKIGFAKKVRCSFSLLYRKLSPLRKCDTFMIPVAPRPERNGPYPMYWALYWQVDPTTRFRTKYLSRVAGKQAVTRGKIAILTTGESPKNI